MSDMNVLDRTGHTTHSWNPKDASEVEAARALFDTLVGKRYQAFRSDRHPSERLKAFDPSVGEITFVPQLAGG